MVGSFETVIDVFDLTWGMISLTARINRWQ
jgi:hypothetical protein